MLKLEEKLRLANSKSVNPKKVTTAENNEAPADLVRAVTRLKMLKVLTKRARREASKVAVLEVTEMVLNLIQDTTRVDQKKNDRGNNCQRLSCSYCWLSYIGISEARCQTRLREMSFAIRYESYNLNYQKKMLKETLTILFTLVCAHQIRDIEIHEPASEFLTGFVEDPISSCGGSRVGCGCCCGCLEGWQITSVPSGTPAWRYTTALEDPQCYSFYTVQSPIVQTYTMTASQTCGPSSTITMNYYCSCQPPGQVIPDITTSVLGPTTTWMLPTAWHPDLTNCGAQIYTLTLVITTALVPATITLTGANTQISVSATSHSMVGEYTYQLTSSSAYHGKTFTSAAFKITINPCILTNYAITGCNSLAEYLTLDLKETAGVWSVVPPRVDSCGLITQTPSCGYDSTVVISGNPNTIMTATVTTLYTVNLATQTADKSLAGTQNFSVTTTPIYLAVPTGILPAGYTYPTTSASHPVSLVVVDSCTRTTIPAQTIPTLSQFVGSSTTSQQSFIFQDSVSAIAQLQGFLNYCGVISWTFRINGLNTVELAGNNVQGTITFSPPLTSNPGTRNANLRASLTNYPTIFVDNFFQVVTVCAPAFTRASQPESPVDIILNPVSTRFTTTAALQFTDYNNCGIVPSYSCMIGGIVCPSWITIDGQKKMTVNTNDSANIGQFIVIIQSTYVSYFGETISLPLTTWVLNVLKETFIAPINPCQKTVIALKDKSIPSTIQVTLTKLVSSPKNFTLPKVTDSYSESLGIFRACGPFRYDVRGKSSDLVTFDKSTKLLTFDSKNEFAVVGKQMIQIFATLSRYPMAPALVFPFEITLLESEKTPEDNSKQALTQKKSATYNDWKTKSAQVNSTFSYVDVWIKSIDQFGEVVVGFGKRMKIREIKEIQNATTTKDGITVPALEVRVVPGLDSNPYLLRYTYNITNMTQTNLTFKLGFENPLEVSAVEIDTLNITFNDPLFEGAQGENIKEGTEISKQIPAQMSDSNMGSLMADIKKFLTPAAQGFTLAQFVVVLLLALTLQKLWSMINAQQIIVLMIAYNTNPPAIALWFFNILFQVQSVDVFPMSDFYDKYLIMELTEPLSENLKQLGFSNRYFIYNFGSSILSIVILPVFFVLWFLFSRFKNIKFFRFLSEKLEKYLFWNGIIATINETFSAVIISAFISIDSLKWNTVGEILSSSLGMFLLLCYLVYPIVMVAVYVKNFDQLEQLRSKIGSMYEGIRLKSGRCTVLLPLFHFIRRVIQAYSIVLTKQFFAQYILLLLTVQASIVIICYLNVYESVEQRRMELFNETMVTLIMYSIMCFTDFVPNPQKRNELGCVTIALICLHFTVNMAIMMQANSSHVMAVLKGHILRIQHRTLRNQRIEAQRKQEQALNNRLLQLIRAQESNSDLKGNAADSKQKSSYSERYWESYFVSEPSDIENQRRKIKPLSVRGTLGQYNANDDSLVSFRAANDKVVPAQQFVQKPVQIYQAKRKKIVEEVEQKIEEIRLVRNKEQFFDRILESLKAIRDPVVQDNFNNLQARLTSHLLPNNIAEITLNEQQEFVRYMITEHEFIKDHEELQAIQERIAQRKLKKKRVIKEEIDDNVIKLAEVEKYLVDTEKQIIVDFRDSEEMNILAFNAVQESELAPDYKKVKAERKAQQMQQRALHLEEELERLNNTADGLKMHKAYYEEVLDDLRQQMERLK